MSRLMMNIVQEQLVFSSIPSNCSFPLLLFWQHLHLNYFLIWPHNSCILHFFYMNVPGWQGISCYVHKQALITRMLTAEYAWTVCLACWESSFSCWDWLLNVSFCMLQLNTCSRSQCRGDSLQYPPFDSHSHLTAGYWSTTNRASVYIAPLNKPRAAELSLWHHGVFTFCFAAWVVRGRLPLASVWWVERSNGRMGEALRWNPLIKISLSDSAITVKAFKIFWTICFLFWLKGWKQSSTLIFAWHICEMQFIRRLFGNEQACITLPDFLHAAV